MWEYEHSDELYHHGVKGMKWGVRKKYRNSDGSLNEKGVKKYAKKGYAKDSMDSNISTAGKVWDAYTGAHKIDASIQYDSSSKKANRERAESYVKDLSDRKNAPASQKVQKGLNASAKIMAKVGSAYLQDQLFFGGMGTKAVKAGAKYAANAAANKMFNTAIIDKNGKVIYRYNS